MQSQPTPTRLLLPAATALSLVSHLWLLARGGSPAQVLISFAVLCLLAGFCFPDRRRLDPGPSCADSSRRLSPSVSASRRSGLLPAAPVNAITIDLEDYFHTEVAGIPFSEWGSMPPRIEYSTHRLLDILDENRTRATVFVLGWLAESHPALVREVAARGHEIACHSYAHRLVFKMLRSEFREDTLKATRLIEDICGVRVEGYRAPCFSITPGCEWAFDTLSELGYRYDSSVNPVWHPTYAAPRAPRHPFRRPGSGLLELPIASVAVPGARLPVGGGAYLRLLPSWYCRAGLASMNWLERKPATLYLHPWELDTYSPLVPQHWASRVRQTWGTSTMESKLRALLAGSAFGPVREVFARELAQADRAALVAEPSTAMAGALSR